MWAFNIEQKYKTLYLAENVHLILTVEHLIKQIEREGIEYMLFLHRNRYDPLVSVNNLIEIATILFIEVPTSLYDLMDEWRRYVAAEH